MQRIEGRHIVMHVIARGEGKAVLVMSQFSHNLSVSLSNYYSAKNLKLTQVEHACSLPPSQIHSHQAAQHRPRMEFGTLLMTPIKRSDEAALPC